MLLGKELLLLRIFNVMHMSSKIEKMVINHSINKARNWDIIDD